MARTAGEAREKLFAIKRAARNKSYDTLMRELRADGDLTENDIALRAFGDGWTAGYKAGYRQALESIQAGILETIKRQHSGIMSEPV